MKKLKKDLLSVNKELKALVKKTESLMKTIDGIEKAPPVKSKTKKKISARKVSKAKPLKKTVAKKPPAKKKAAKLNDTDKVINIIKKSKKGVSAKSLVKKTGFDAKKVANIVFRTAKRGMIRSVSKGVYVGA